jgi:hypothetical protein
MRSMAAGSLVLASVALLFAPAPARAQESSATPAPTPGDKDGFCRTCGHKIDAAVVCPFCGAGNTYPKKPVHDVKPVDEGVTPAPPAAPKGGTAPGATAPPIPAKPEAVAPEDGTDPRSRAYRDDNMAKGDYYFKTGYYLKASEAYRVAVLSEPTNPWKKLAFGHALFAIGNYSYASYALRRAVTQLDPSVAFQPDVASLFPSKRAFEKAVKDLKRYVTYSPRDPAGLSVLGYMLFSQGEDDRAREMFVYLQRLPKNDQDPFAGFFVKQITARAGRGPMTDPGPPIGEPKEVAPVPPTPPAPPVAKQAPVTAPEAGRQDEEPAKVKPSRSTPMDE